MLPVQSKNAYYCVVQEPISTSEYEPELTPASVTEAVPTGQIIFGFDFFPGAISWEEIITDPEDVALIESFLRDLQPIEMGEPPLPPTGGTAHYLSLVLDGVQTSFFISQSTFGSPSDRVFTIQYYPPIEFPENFRAVDWRIWQVLLPYDHGFHSNEIMHIMPRHSLTLPQNGVYPLGKIFEQSGINIQDIRQINIRTSGHRSRADITDAAELAEILDQMTQVQLTYYGASEQLHQSPPVLSVNILTDDFVATIFLSAEALGVLFSPSYAVFYGEGGTQLHARLVELLDGEF